MLDNKTLLITGGTGSFAKTLASTVLQRYTPKKIIIFSRDELKQFEMQNAEPFASNRKAMRYFLGDVRDRARLERAMEDVDIVVHSAALKQIPATEYNPFEAVLTNVIGAQNVIDAAMSRGVKKVVALSTDKAAAPINLYGATKLTSDKLFVAANNYKGSREIKLSVVRYGNVLGSRGSVVPFFLGKKHTGILPVTDERMTRFSITPQQGVDFVLRSLDRMWGGELFVPRIPSYRILDVARAIAPEAAIQIVGRRPGEKLHEEMITQPDALNTIEFEDYFVILPSMELWDKENFRLTSNGKPGKLCDVDFRYNSGTNDHFLTIDELRSLIAENVHA
ncbi:MAG TPA: UDP-N-acetylglucosamine 4,6-dehydratase (inverting) [Bacteroidota bacterium]|nr:UDP-N-acetylglucosamine 4,6-dehydratase (inverting) [Bacteroidota bacterium]